MTTKELSVLVGEDVWVYLPYDGGCGWAKVVDARAEPEHRRPGATVRVAFYEGEVFPYYDEGVKLVRPADVLRAGKYPGPRMPRTSPLVTALEALKKYGEHLWDCSLQKDLTVACTCGLDAVVEMLEQEA